MKMICCSVFGAFSDLYYNVDITQIHTDQYHTDSHAICGSHHIQIFVHFDWNNLAYFDLVYIIRKGIPPHIVISITFSFKVVH